MQYRSRIRRLVVVVVVAALLIIVGVVVMNKHSASQKAARHRVVVGNIGQYKKDLNPNVISSIEHQIYSRASSYSNDDAASYHGEIRSGSYNRHTAEYDGAGQPVQVPQTEFLVDIPSAKQTYLVRWGGGPGYPYDILYVLCPSSSQLIYGDFGCVDKG